MRGMLLSLEMNKVLLSADEDASKRTMNWMPVMGKLVEGKLMDEEQVGALVEGNSEKGLELGLLVGCEVDEFELGSALGVELVGSKVSELELVDGSELGSALGDELVGCKVGVLVGSEVNMELGLWLGEKVTGN
jgi:hypothetical protein